MLKVKKRCFGLREIHDQVLRLYTTSLTRRVEFRD